MGLQDLEELDIFLGTFGFIWVIIAVLIGIRIIWKAISLNRKDLITVGLTWIFASSAWWGVAVQFITYGFFDYRLNEFQYLFVANFFIPIALFCWIFSFCQIINPNLKKNLLLTYIAFCVIWEIFLLGSMFTNNIQLVGTLEGIFDSKHSPIGLVFIGIAVISFLVTGCIFSLKSMKVNNKEIQWKGRFLLIAWIFFTIGALMDAALPEPTAISIIIVRLILISSAIEFYLGWFLPEKIVKLLIK